MTPFFFLFSLVGLGLFYFQNLVLFPQVRLRLLDLLVFYVGLRPSLPLAFALALCLGLLQDSYASTPVGLHVVASLALVAAARFSRRRFLPQSLLPQVVASLAALSLEEVVLQLTLFLTGARRFPLSDFGLLEILCTGALAPLMFYLLRKLEKFMNLLGWRALSSRV
jgi:rod shape-determining protein MreD